MIDDTLYVLTFAAAIGSGLVAGIFFAFSTSIMAALSRVPQPMRLSRVKEECQEGGMTKLLARNSSGFKDVELVEACFELLQVRIVNDERFERRPI